MPKPLFGPTKEQLKELDQYNKRIKGLQAQILPLYEQIRNIERARIENWNQLPGCTVIAAPDTNYQKLKQKHEELLEELKEVAMERDEYKKMANGFNY